MASFLYVTTKRRKVNNIIFSHCTKHCTELFLQIQISLIRKKIILTQSNITSKNIFALLLFKSSFSCRWYFRRRKRGSEKGTRWGKAKSWEGLERERGKDEKKDEEEKGIDPRQKEEMARCVRLHCSVKFSWGKGRIESKSLRKGFTFQDHEGDVGGLAVGRPALVLTRVVDAHPEYFIKWVLILINVNIWNLFLLQHFEWEIMLVCVDQNFTIRGIWTCGLRLCLKRCFRTGCAPRASLRWRTEAAHIVLRCGGIHKKLSWYGMKISKLLVKQETWDDSTTWSDVKVKTNLVVEIPKDVVGRLRRSDEACYGVGGTNIQENLLLPLNLTRRLWSGGSWFIPSFFVFNVFIPSVSYIFYVWSCVTYNLQLYCVAQVRHRVHL